MKLRLTSAVALAMLAFGPWLSAQNCPFDPTVTGNLLLCPQTTDTLRTQQYDSYQWYTRPFSGGDSLSLVPGATDSTYAVSSDSVPFYVAVEATLNGCTERSPEVLVDGLAFLPLTVSSEGEFTIGPNGELIICTGDTVLLIALLPYTLNHQWYDGDNPIPGANDDTLVVTQPGSYTLTASPGQCPNIVAHLGVFIDVVYGNTPGCVTAVTAPHLSLDVTVGPNPAQATIQVSVADAAPVELTLLDSQGRVVRTHKFSGSMEMMVGDLPRGVYALQLLSKNGQAVRRVVLD
jgi:hypothetical protein